MDPPASSSHSGRASATPGKLSVAERKVVGSDVAVSVSCGPPQGQVSFGRDAVEVWISDAGARWEVQAASADPVALDGASVVILPAAVTVRSDWHSKGRLLSLRVSSGFAADVIAGRPLTFAAGALSRWEVHDALIASLLGVLGRELDAPGTPDVCLLSLAGCLASRVLRVVPAATAATVDGTRILSEESLRRVEARVEMRLTERVTTEELAREVGLGASRFRVLFKATLGLTPEQYVLRRRLLRARALIEAGRQTIGEVAHAVGFADHSHLTVRFRAFFGVAPRSLLPSVRRR
jgi:AraC family transcriptional regulator